MLAATKPERQAALRDVFGILGGYERQADIVFANPERRAQLPLEAVSASD
jgi:hypothetical protein